MAPLEQFKVAGPETKFYNYKYTFTTYYLQLIIMLSLPGH